MIYGIGIDMVEIERINQLLERQENTFLPKIFTEKEIQYIPTGRKRKGEYIAGRFAGKEAVAKALGTGIGKKCGWRDIEIIAMPSGKPVVKLHAENFSESLYHVHISISHTEMTAIAKVIIEQK